MAHVSYHAGTSGKATKYEVTKQQSHTYRKDEKRSKPHSNKLINESLSQFNFEKTRDNKSIDELVLDRIEKDYNGKRGLQKNQVVTREAISGINAEYYDGMSFDEKRDTAINFSEDAYEWYQNEFGEENVLGYAVHVDETNPHTHFTIMPMTDDGRVNQKEFWKSPGHLKRQHREFREHMIDKGWDIEIENVNQGKFIDFEAEIYKENADIINALRDKVNNEITTLKETDVNQEVYNQLVADGVDEIQEKNTSVINQMDAFNKELGVREVNVSKKETEASERELETNRHVLELETEKLAFNDEVSQHNHQKQLDEDEFNRIEEENKLKDEEQRLKDIKQAKKDEEQAKTDKEQKDREIKLNKKAQRQDNNELVATAGVNAMLVGDKRFENVLNNINENGLSIIKPESLQNVIGHRVESIRSGEKSIFTVSSKENLDKDVTRRLNERIAEAEDDSPEL